MAVFTRMLVSWCLLASVASASTVDRTAQQVPNAAMQRVIGMLEQLVADMDSEQQADDKQFEEFTAWCNRQKEVTSRSIEELQTLIEELAAKLANLYAQREELQGAIAALDQQISETRTQIQVATEKRGEEHNSFLTEQQNFDASIAACGKAVEVLAAHYGEPPKEAERPAWMSLMQQTRHTLRKALSRQHQTKGYPSVMAFLDGGKDRYQDSRGESDNIVAQMQELSDTFASDKQSSINEENKLQEMYNKLMEEKTTLLNTLIAERDAKQKILNQVNVDIAETEGAKSAAEGELADEQAYLAQVTKSCADATELYGMRKHDRQQETMAVGEAIKILAPQVGSALLETARSTRKMASKNHLRGRGMCKGCEKAATMLMQAARTYSSEILAAAATATTQNDALKDIIAALDGLINRLHQDQEMEDKHKQWCETELSETAQRKSHHEALVSQLSATIADLTETIAEKVQALQENAESIQLADKNFAEATAIREMEHTGFETELRNYVESLTALNTAIDVLAKFYSSQLQVSANPSESLLQISHSSKKVAPREMAPGVFTGVYEQKGGKGVIEMIATVRTEFETGKRDLEAAEKQAQEDFEAAKAAYQKMRRDLVSEGDKLTVEKQTAENEMDQAVEDKATNEQEVAAAKAYLVQLGSSCDVLLKNYDSRKQQRTEEEEAIAQAKKVLEEEA